ncbi:MAG: hypothetical protein QXY18_00520 [Nitrososphaerota archaeon]
MNNNKDMKYFRDMVYFFEFMENDKNRINCFKCKFFIRNEKYCEKLKIKINSFVKKCRFFEEA